MFIYHIYVYIIRCYYNIIMYMLSVEYNKFTGIPTRFPHRHRSLQSAHHRSWVLIIPII